MPDAKLPPSAAQVAVELKALIAAERAGGPFLHVRAGDGHQRIFGLPDGSGRATIGRHSECDIALAWDPEVSRLHALVERVGSEWTFVDDGLSSNGSFINGTRVVGRHRLKDGDRLCCGETILIYRDPVARDAASTERGSSQPGSATLTAMQRKVLVALCRPISNSASATPATNRQIAGEVFLSVDAVKSHLRLLFKQFGLDELPQNEKRARLVATVLATGVLSPRDF
ncbi:MAG: FHA domain-containing protein [Solirubrobacterales bacterium]